MKALIFTLLITALIFGVKFLLEKNRNKWFFRNSKNQALINALVLEYNLIQIDKENYKGSIHGYYSEFEILIRQSYMNPNELRIEINYEPESKFESQELTIKKLRMKYPKYTWVSNTIRTEFPFKYDYPKLHDVKQKIEEIKTIFETENLRYYSSKESKLYHKKWDSN